MKHTYWRYQADRTLQCTQSAIDIPMNADRGEVDWACRRMFGITKQDNVLNVYEGKYA